MPYPAYEYDSPFFDIRWLDLTFGVWCFTLLVLVVMLIVVHRWSALGAFAIGVVVLGLCFFSFAIPHVIDIDGRECFGPRAVSAAPDSASSDPCYRLSQVQLAFAILSPLVYLAALAMWRRGRRSPVAKAVQPAGSSV